MTTKTLHRVSPVSQLFDQGPLWPAAVLRRFADEAANGERWVPPVDIVEREEAFEVLVELPGLAREDIHVTVEKNILTLSGQRSAPEGEGTFHRTERAHGSFTRSFTFPQEVDNEKVTASFADGVLTLTLPKKEETLPRRISID